MGHPLQIQGVFWETNLLVIISARTRSASSFGLFGSLLLRVLEQSLVIPDLSGYLVFVIRNSTIRLSGLGFAQSSLSACAHDTENTSSDRFTSPRVVDSEASIGVLAMNVDALDTFGQEGQISEALLNLHNNFNGALETVNRIAAQRSLEANVLELRAHDQMTRSLLDLAA